VFAILRYQIPSGNVDRENFVVKGCQLSKVGKLAVYMDGKGERKEMLITPRLIDSLLSLWHNKERGDAHWGHDWLDTDRDPINFKVATWRNFRKDDEGNLVADAFLWPSEHREAILNAAENDPQGMMVSQVFDHDGGRDDAIATRVFAADFVSEGAATTALLSAKLTASLTTKTKNARMAISLDELKEALSTPDGKAMIRGCLDAHDDMSDDDAAEMEDAAGVEDDDKKKEDKQSPAAMRVLLRYGRTIARLRKLVAKPDTTAILAEVRGELKTIAQAEATAVLGKGAIMKSADGKFVSVGDEAESYIKTAIAGGCKNRALAKARMAKDRPELYARMNGVELAQS
jgi:hypothetical protein